MSKTLSTGEIERDLKVFETLEKALKGTLAIAFGGILKEIRHELGFDDSKKKEDDLINSDDENIETTVEEVVAKWNNERKNYFVI